MSSLWPWLAVAGAGALHGLNPCTGWALAAACGGRSGDGRQTLRALAPIAAGHAASVGLVAGLVVLGLAGVGWLALPAGVLLLAALLLRLSRRTGPRLRARAGCAGLALGSFMAATLHGSGMMLVPALVPLCLSNGSAKEITASGSLLLALAAVAVHMAAMLGATAVVALAASRVFAAGLLRKALPARAHSAPPRDARLLERLEVPCSRPHRGIACCPCRPWRQRARHRRGPCGRGARVIVKGRTQAAVDAAIAAIQDHTGRQALGFAGDLSRADVAEALVRRYPGIAILVNNLGIFEPKPFEEIPDADWLRFFDVNVLSGVRLARLCLPAMKTACCRAPPARAA